MGIVYESPRFVDRGKACASQAVICPAFLAKPQLSHGVNLCALPWLSTRIPHRPRLDLNSAV